MYIRELKFLRKSTLVWALSLCGVAALYFSVYPGMAADMEEFKAVLLSYPPAIQAMFGVDIAFLGSFNGYYAMTFSFVGLCGAIQAMNLGLTFLSRETREHTADFLLTKPVSRARIVLSKTAASLTALLCTEAVYFLFSYLGAAAVAEDGFGKKQFFLIGLSLVFLQFIFFTLGAAVSVLLKKVRSVPAVSLGLVFGLFFIGVLTTLGDSKAWERYLSPFRYIDTTYVLLHTAYEPRFLFAGVCVVAVLALVTWSVYLKKDIHAVA